MKDLIIAIGFLLLIIVLGWCSRNWVFTSPLSKKSPPRIIVYGNTPESFAVVNGLRQNGYCVFAFGNIHTSLSGLSAIALLALSNNDANNLTVCRLLQTEKPSILCYTYCHDTLNIRKFEQNHVKCFLKPFPTSYIIDTLFPKLELRSKK